MKIDQVYTLPDLHEFIVGAVENRDPEALDDAETLVRGWIQTEDEEVRLLRMIDAVRDLIYQSFF